MSRAARNSKALRSGAIGFLVGLATLGVVAHGSPARDLLTETSSSVRALAVGLEGTRDSRVRSASAGQSVQPVPAQQPQSRAS